MRVLFISDIHIKHNNVKEMMILTDKLQELNPKTYDFAVVAGDILDSHEKVNVQLLNRAYHMIRILKAKTHVFVCVGNHDMLDNQQFLSDGHWLNGMKEWDNVTIVDVPVEYKGFVFMPYVYQGRFIEALNTMSFDWKTATCIFAHQEIRGCKMGAFESVVGDVWDLELPLIISGHIHERQQPQPNVFYPGSVLTHAFGGKVDADQGLAIFTFKDGQMSEQRISLDIRPKKTIHIKVGQGVNVSDLANDTRLIITGTADEIASHKQGKQNAVLVKKGVKVVYKLDSARDVAPCVNSGCSFVTILENLVKNIGDENLTKDYLSVIC